MMFRGRKLIQSNSYTHSGASGGNFAYKILVIKCVLFLGGGGCTRIFLSEQPLGTFQTSS